MKKVPLVIGLGILLALALTPVIIFGNNLAAVQGRSSIYGSVYGEGHRPVADVYVELLDDVNSTVRQIKTDMSGRFQFSGLVDGRYMIKIRPGNTGYQEHTQQVIISAISSVRVNDRSSGADNQHIDIGLKLDERYTLGPFAGAPSVIFVQDVPPAAKQLYDQGLAFMREKKQAQALASLRQAIEVFPDYYHALDRLGAEYAILGDPATPVESAALASKASTGSAAKDEPSKEEYLQAGLLLLAKATQINSRSYSSMFGLGWSQFNLGRFADASESFGKAANIYNKSANAFLWQGKAYRRNKKADKAEEALKQADRLSNGKNAEIHWELAGLYNDQKRYTEAADHMELYLKSVPKGEAEKIKELIRKLREKAK